MRGVRGQRQGGTHEYEPERPEVRPGPDYQLLGFAQTGKEHTDNMETEADFLEEELIEESNVTIEDLEASGSGDGNSEIDDALTLGKTNEKLDDENEKQEESKDELGTQHHEDATSLYVPRDHKSKIEKSPDNGSHSSEGSTSSGCMIIPKRVYLIILLFIR